MKELFDAILRQVPLQVKVGKVTAFDKKKGLADVQINDGPEQFDIRVRAVADDKDTGLVITPKTGSYVLVASIENKPESSYICGFSEIDEFYIKIPDVEFTLDKNGCLLKVPQAELNLTKDVLSVKIPQSELVIDKQGILMKQGSNVMGAIVGEFLDAIMQLTVTTGTGPSGTPINMASFQMIKQKFSQLLKNS